MKFIIKKQTTLIKIILTLLVYSFIFFHYKVSVTNIYKSNVLDSKWIFLSIIMAILLNPFFISNRWRIFLKYAFIKEKIFSLIKINFISVFYGIALPSSVGSDIVRIILIEKRHSIKGGKSGSTVIAERILGFFLLSIIGLSGALYLEPKMSVDNLITIMAFVSISIFGLIIIISKQFALNIVKSLLTRIIKLTDVSIFISILSYIDNLYQSLYDFPLKKSFLNALPFMVCFQLSNILICSFLFYSFGIELELYIHLALLPIITILTIIPISISGFGIREGAFVYFYNLMGVPPEISIAVSLLFFVVTTGLSAIIGGLLVLFTNIKKTDFL